MRQDLVQENNKTNVQNITDIGGIYRIYLKILDRYPPELLE
jgi:hypothetical protein